MQSFIWRKTYMWYVIDFGTLLFCYRTISIIFITSQPRLQNKKHSWFMHEPLFFKNGFQRAAGSLHTILH